jgi:predicted TIM-barrel fold metal-dependent hydrolase
MPGTRLTNPRTPNGGVNVAGRSYKGKKLPVEYIKEGRLFFGCEADEEEIPEFTREFSADCLLYASDIPHFDRYFDSVSMIEERKDISDEVKRKILIDNVARFYGMPVPTKQPAGT